MSNEKLSTPVQYVKGVGPKLAKLFARLGVATVEDLFYFCPRAYEDRTHIKPIRQLQPAEQEIVRGEIVDIDHHQARGRFSVLKVFLGDKSATIQAVFFNQPFLERTFRPGMRLIVSGRVEYSKFDGIMQVLAKDYEIDTGEPLKIVPIYHLTEGLYPKKLRSVVSTALVNFLQYIDDPEDRAAIRTLHQPEELEKVEAARHHLAFRELFIFELGLLLHRHTIKEETKGIAYKIDQKELERFIELLPFKLTGAQNRVLNEIISDMQSPRPMHRLLQGDVGSGKTVVAALAALIAQKSGYQTAILAPTEILANQHFEKIGKLLAAEKVTLKLATQATSRKQKTRGGNFEEDIVIGTHALLEEKVSFRNLGLAIIDEQHRFGVEQRATLIRKGRSPDLLVMTATPIPRSLALILYGDLDRSIIDEMPPGRIPVKTHFVPEAKRASAYEFIRQKMKEGRQVFVICPLVEESEELDLKAAIDEADRLQKQIFPELSVGLIHGRQKSAEKDAIMQQFRDGKIDLLVSTTVIEVGIDVPNATVMVIEHAERFGLSQLHQLRGRIGRGGEQSICFLIGEPKTAEARARIKVMLETNDGFKIAEADLRLRGPGEVLGLRQSGLPNFRVADIIRDEKILLEARSAAAELLEKDPVGARNCWDRERQKIKGPAQDAGGSALN